MILAFQPRELTLGEAEPAARKGLLAGAAADAVTWPAATVAGERRLAIAAEEGAATGNVLICEGVEAPTGFAANGLACAMEVVVGAFR